jgi:hypothetical protein
MMLLQPTLASAMGLHATASLATHDTKSRSGMHHGLVAFICMSCLSFATAHVRGSPG